MNQLQNDPAQAPKPYPRRRTYGRFAFEFLSIFVAVISAFALNNWNEERRDRNAEEKILSEIRNGLEQDKADIGVNMYGHTVGLAACDYWQQVIQNEPVPEDCIAMQLLNLTRDFIAIQNRAGYESLKSKGLELITDDTLRLDIIAIYEYDFATLKNLEEQYEELQFQRNYFRDFRDILGPYLIWDQEGKITGIRRPVQLSDKEKSVLMMDLWKIRTNRQFALFFYKEVNRKIDRLVERIQHSVPR